MSRRSGFAKCNLHFCNKLDVKTSVHVLTYEATLCTLTDTCSIASFGHAIGTEVNTGVTSPCVFALLVRAANSLSALINICSEDTKREKV